MTQFTHKFFKKRKLILKKIILPIRYTFVTNVVKEECFLMEYLETFFTVF